MTNWQDLVDLWTLLTPFDRILLGLVMAITVAAFMVVGDWGWEIIHGCFEGASDDHLRS